MELLVHERLIQLGRKAVHLAQFAGLGPYRRSLSHFHTIFRPAGVDTISLHKSECMVDALGTRLERQRQQEIEELFRHAGSVEVADEIVGTMVVCIDAGKVPTKGNQRVDDHNRKQIRPRVPRRQGGERL